jgi:hypothetical protein
MAAAALVEAMGTMLIWLRQQKPAENVARANLYAQYHTHEALEYE